MEATETERNLMTCCQWIRDEATGGCRQCTRKATFATPSGKKGVCSQHARPMDLPMVGGGGR